MNHSMTKTPATRALLAATTLASLAAATPAAGQVFDNGPSDPGLFDTVVNHPTDPLPLSGNNIGGTGTLQLNLSTGTAIGNDINILAGTEVNFDAGTIGLRFEVFSGTEFNISGTAVLGSQADIETGSVLNLSGGTIGLNLDVFGIANITAGSIDNGLDIKNGGVMHLSGGSIGTGDILSGGTLNLSGGSIGTSFDVEAGGVFNMTGGSIGSTFDVFGTATISDGSIGQTFEAESGSVVNITGGIFDDGFNAKGGSLVTISGGTHGNSFDAESGSVVSISDGTFGFTFNPNAGSEVEISGGSFGNFFTNEGKTEISGGSYGNNFRANSGSETHFVGTAFFIDGVAVAGLALPGDSVVITDRDVTLTGTLADGSVIAFDLNSVFASNADFFASDATVSVALVPEPGSLAGLALGGLALIARRRHDSKA